MNWNNSVLSVLLRRCGQIALAAGLAAPVCAAERAIRIATIEENRPLVIASKRILQLAYQRIGVPMEFVVVPSRRGQNLVESGDVDGVLVRFFPVPDSVARQISVPIARDEAVAFSTTTHFPVNGYASLQPYVVGYVLGITYFAQQLSNTRTETAPNLESLFRKLDAGRTDVAVDVRSSLCVAQKLGLTNIHILEPALSKGAPGYHALNGKHQALIQKLEVVLQQMENQGEIKHIYDNAMQEFMARCTPP